MLRSTLLFIAATGVSAVEISSLGCFTGDSQTLSEYIGIDDGAYTFESIGHCLTACGNIGHSYLALTNGNQCWCGDAVPPISDLVDAENCNLPCAGYAKQICGGANDFSVYLSGPDSEIQSIISSYTAAEASATTVASSDSTTRSSILATATAAFSESSSSSSSTSGPASTASTPATAAATTATTTKAPSVSSAVVIPSASTSGHTTVSGTSASPTVSTGAAVAVNVQVGFGTITGLMALALGL